MSKFRILSPFLLFFIHFHTNYAANSSCPIDFSYVETFPWDSSLCHEPAQSGCCQTLHSVFGMGLAQYVKQTSMFYLPDVNTSSSCIANFEEKLASMSISSSLFASCFNDTGEFVNIPSTSCAGIATTQDWIQKVYTSIPLDSACNGDLTGFTRCSLCIEAGLKMKNYLATLQRNSAKCFLLSVMYAAAIVNDLGLTDPGTASCIFGIPLSASKTGKNGNRTNRKLIFAFVGGFVGVCFAVILVYDFMSNGSLDEHLFSSGKKPLSWPQRKNIILNVAKGLAYLHYGIKPAIYHRDIKATNILLDSDMKARVADFGLAKQSTEGQYHLTTRVAGTYGYLAPEYVLYGQLTEKSDVYSFGILIVEIMSGRRVLDASDPYKILITDWAWALLKSGKYEEIFHASIRNDGPKGVMERFVLVGILSAHVMVALRPTIADALKMLEGDIDIPRLPERPLPLSHQSFQTSLNNSMSTTTSEGSRAMPSFSSSR